MPSEDDRRSETPTHPKAIRFVKLSAAAMTALLDGDLAGASATTGIELTEYLLSDEIRWLWSIRINQLATDPTSAHWIVRAAVAEPGGFVIGTGGFHGPPDASGMVEVAYSVDPAHRRRGYARMVLRELLRRAAAEPDVRTVRATISPDNTASLNTIAGFGFTQVGEEWDEEDGLEIIFEIPATNLGERLS